MLLTKKILTGDIPTRSPLTLYGALLSVMEVCVRLNFPDNSCQTLNASLQVSDRICAFTVDCNPQLLTRENRTVFPESHSPTRRTALLTVLLVRKYFRNTEKRRRYSRLLQLMTFTPGLRSPSFLPGLIHLIILNDNVPNQAKFRQYNSECRADIPALQQPLF